MAKSTYVYVTYIRTTPQKLWRALISPEFTMKYWCGIKFDTDWKKGSDWKMVYPDGTVTDTGTILEMKPPKRLVLTWRNEFRPALKAEGISRCTMQIEKIDGGVVKLTITHTINRPKSKFIDAVSGGWPVILSNLKSLLETGRVAYDFVK
jgi:uncharacterized protein YndB with AHSA1/START domain